MMLAGEVGRIFLFVVVVDVTSQKNDEREGPCLSALGPWYTLNI